MLPLFVLWFSCCLCFFYTFEHFVLSYCLNCQVAKMADDVQEDIVNALNTIASSTERSSNMKKELKHIIYESVSTLRKLFLKLKEISDGKSRKITELQTLVTATKAELEGVRDNTAKTLATPSIAPRRGWLLV